MWWWSVCAFEWILGSLRLDLDGVPLLNNFSRTCRRKTATAIVEAEARRFMPWRREKSFDFISVPLLSLLVLLLLVDTWDNCLLLLLSNTLRHVLSCLAVAEIYGDITAEAAQQQWWWRKSRWLCRAVVMEDPEYGSASPSCRGHLCTCTLWRLYPPNTARQPASNNHGAGPLQSKRISLRTIYKCSLLANIEVNNNATLSRNCLNNTKWTFCLTIRFLIYT